MSSGTLSRIPGGRAGGSRRGSPPAPGRLENLARWDGISSVVVGMNVSFVQANTVPKPLSPPTVPGDR